MNMSAYEADTAWNWVIPCNPFKTLIKLYLLCLFLYYFTYCIKEGIKVNIFGDYIKIAGLWGSYGLKQGNPLHIKKK